MDDGVEAGREEQYYLDLFTASLPGHATFDLLVQLDERQHPRPTMNFTMQMMLDKCRGPNFFSCLRLLFFLAEVGDEEERDDRWIAVCDKIIERTSEEVLDDHQLAGLANAIQYVWRVHHYYGEMVVDTIDEELHTDVVKALLAMDADDAVADAIVSIMRKGNVEYDWVVGQNTVIGMLCLVIERHFRNEPTVGTLAMSLVQYPKLQEVVDEYMQGTEGWFPIHEQYDGSQREEAWEEEEGEDLVTEGEAVEDEDEEEVTMGEDGEMDSLFPMVGQRGYGNSTFFKDEGS
jgi:hypothetical protein